MDPSSLADLAGPSHLAGTREQVNRSKGISNSSIVLLVQGCAPIPTMTLCVIWIYDEKYTYYADYDYS